MEYIFPEGNRTETINLVLYNLGLKVLLWEYKCIMWVYYACAPLTWNRYYVIDDYVQFTRDLLPWDFQKFRRDSLGAIMSIVKKIK